MAVQTIVLQHHKLFADAGAFAGGGGLINSTAGIARGGDGGLGGGGGAAIWPAGTAPAGSRSGAGGNGAVFIEFVEIS